MNQGRSVFAQLAELLPRRAFENAVSRYQGDRRVRNLSCMDQLLALLFAQLTGRSSRRETVSCFLLIHATVPAAIPTIVNGSRNRSQCLSYSSPRMNEVIESVPAIAKKQQRLVSVTAAPITIDRATVTRRSDFRGVGLPYSSVGF